MKPERIQFAPWISQWIATLPFLLKVFACDTEDDATHCANHVRRVARFYTHSKVKTSIDEEFVVNVRILPGRGEVLTDAQYALGQVLDEALSFLEGPDQTGPDEEDGDSNPVS